MLSHCLLIVFAFQGQHKQFLTRYQQLHQPEFLRQISQSKMRLCLKHLQRLNSIIRSLQKSSLKLILELFSSRSNPKGTQEGNCLQLFRYRTWKPQMKFHSHYIHETSVNKEATKASFHNWKIWDTNSKLNKRRLLECTKHWRSWFFSSGIDSL